MMTRTLLLAVLGLSLAVSHGHAQNLIANGNFGTGDLTGWSIRPTAPATITYDASQGNGGGSAALARIDSAAAGNGNYLYQIIPVTIGSKYKLSAEWQGNLLNGGTGRNWAEVYIAFGATAAAIDPAVATLPGSAITYKRATDGNNATNPVTAVPYTNPWTWENITSAPNSTTIGPADGIFTSTGDFMLVAFNVGGRAQTSNNTQPGFFNVDNVSLTAVVGTSSGNFNGDAFVDGADLLIWQRGLGLTGQTTKANGDANGDGTVNGGDLLVWRQQFGTSGSLVAQSAIPEPMSATLLALGLWATLGMRRARESGVGVAI